MGQALLGAPEPSLARPVWKEHSEPPPQSYFPLILLMKNTHIHMYIHDSFQFGPLHSTVPVVISKSHVLMCCKSYVHVSWSVLGWFLIVLCAVVIMSYVR